MKKLIILSFVLFLTGTTYAVEPAAPPPWIQKATVEPGKHYEWGTGISKQMAVANSMARQDAMTKMSYWLSTHMEVYSAAFTLEVSNGEGSTESATLFQQVVKATTDTILKGLVTENTDVQMDMRNFRCYVLMSMPLEMAAVELKRQLTEKTDFYDRYASSSVLKSIDLEAKVSNSGAAKPPSPPRSGQ